MERIYTIPLRKAFRKPRTKRGPVSIRLIKSYLSRHMKIDEEKIKIGSALNDLIWTRGISYPPRRIKINAILDNDILRVELIGHKYEEFKVVKKVEKEGMKDKLMKRLGAKAIKKQEEENKAEGKPTGEKKKEEEPSDKIETAETGAEKKEEPSDKIEIAEKDEKKNDEKEKKDDTKKKEEPKEDKSGD